MRDRSQLELNLQQYTSFGDASSDDSLEHAPLSFVPAQEQCLVLVSAGQSTRRDLANVWTVLRRLGPSVGPGVISLFLHTNMSIVLADQVSLWCRTAC